MLIINHLFCTHPRLLFFTKSLNLHAFLFVSMILRESFQESLKILDTCAAVQFAFSPK